MDDNKRKALDAALGQIDRQFGKGSVMRLGDAPDSQDIACYSTGSIGLDIALGIGGLPKGRVIEIYGPESSRQNHAHFIGYRPSAKGRRHGGLYRCRARFGSGVRRSAGRQYGRVAGLAARHRRASTGDRRHVGALGGGGCGGDRFGRRAHPEGGNRGRHGRPPCRLASGA